MRVAACQMASGENIEANFETACRLLEEAAGRGARFVTLPENALYLGPKKGMGMTLAGSRTSEYVTAFGEMAAHYGVYLLVGSVREKIPRSKKVYNTALVFAPDGGLLLRYRKMHLFDIHVPGRVTERESAIFKPGAETPVAAMDEFTLGVTICYDLRFPELYRRLVDQGADVVCVPSNFTLTTGKDHWRPLLAARAIENQAFVIAPAQCGAHHGGRRSYGHSLIVDPWGTALAEAPEDWVGVITADLDSAMLDRVRANLPSLAHRRADMFRY